MQKAVKSIEALRFERAFPGLSGVNVFAHQHPIEPVLVFTEFHMDRSVFGPHPHAGISVITYLLPSSKGSFINRDSRGDHSIIEPGGLHITQAGSGIQHDEFPLRKGTDCHGFQIWINHADRDRLAAPKAMHADAAQVPQVVTDAYQVRVIHGAFAGQRPPYRMVTPVVLLDVTLHPRATLTLAAQEMAFLYGIGGAGFVPGQSFGGQNLLLFGREGDAVTVTGGEQPCHFLFATGRPHREPIVYGGPFVMTTTTQMAATKKRYEEGTMGTLAPAGQGTG